MRLILPLLAALSLSACASADQKAFIGLVKDAAKDPRCGHTDRISGNIGGINPVGVTVFFERQCPTPATAAPAKADAGAL